jgi:hypothetical protein
MQIVTILAALMLLSAIVIVCAKLWNWKRTVKLMANASNATSFGIHEDSLTRLTDAAITVRHLLYKVGSDADHVAVSGASDLPIGTCDDEASAAEELVTIKLINKGATKRMVASEAMASAGVVVYAAASGKIALSGTVVVGTLLTTAGADGDVVEVADVSSNSSTPGIAASTYDAHTILYATTDNTPAALTVGASTIVGRKASGNISAMTALETATVIGNGVGRIGYFGGGGAGTQGTNATTTVVLDKPSGTITLHGTQSLAAGAEQVFTFTNSFITATSVVLVHRASGGTGGTPVWYVSSVAAGSCVIGCTNLHASTAETGADLVLNFVVLNAAAA